MLNSARPTWTCCSGATFAASRMSKAGYIARSPLIILGRVMLQKRLLARRASAPLRVLINALSAEEVYEHLIENLPYDETRNYLRKVRAAQAKYKQLDVVGA